MSDIQAEQYERHDQTDREHEVQEPALADVRVKRRRHADEPDYTEHLPGRTHRLTLGSGTL